MASGNLVLMLVTTVHSGTVSSFGDNKNGRSGFPVYASNYSTGDVGDADYKSIEEA